MSTLNPTYTALEIRRIGRDATNLFFIIGLPALLYVVFGMSEQNRDETIGHGNVAMYIMISMAAYGAVMATVTVGGMAAVERMQGWGRQLALTPMRDHSYVLIKTLVGLLFAASPVALIFFLGYLSGAEAPLWVWAASFAIVALGAAMFAIFGLAVGLAFRSENAVGVAGGAVVILAFLGNLFFPLSGIMLTIAKFTPLYGYAGLARYPLTEGVLPQIDGTRMTDPLWLPALNVGVWTAIFAIAATLLVRRARARQ